MGTGVGLPRDRRKNWDWDIPRARNTLWNHPWPHPSEICQGPRSFTDKSQTSGGQKTAYPTFQNKITKKTPKNLGQRKRFLPRANPGNRNAATATTWEGKVQSWNSTGGQGWVCSWGFGSLKLFLKLDFILGQGFSMRDTHMHFCFQNSCLPRGKVGTTFTFIPLYQIPVMLKCQRQKFHLSGRNVKVYGTTENWKSELPWALHNKVTCSQGEMQDAEWFPWLQSLKNPTKQLKTMPSSLSPIVPDILALFSFGRAWCFKTSD